MLPTGDTQINDTNKLKVKSWKIFLIQKAKNYTKSKNEGAGVTITGSDKIDFKIKNVTGIRYY